MDTEEAKEIAHHQRIGHPQTDEGPYYHNAWWEGYKGGVKGMLGGLIIGAIVGALMGALVMGGLALAGIPLAGIGIAAVIGGFSALGAYHGAHEFNQVGIVTGAVSASHERAEERMKEFEDSRFAELKRDIAGLKAVVTGERPPEPMAVDGEPDGRAVDANHRDYRTQHCSEGHCPPEMKPVFWKVAGIGLAVGAAAGALFGGSGLMGHLLHPIAEGLAQNQITAASTIVGGAAGASFGINRDLFRRVFDVTDHWFRGIVIPPANGGEKARTQDLSPFPPSPALRKTETPSPRVLLTSTETSRSTTFYQDAETVRRAALLALDHTQVRRPH